MSSLRLSSTVRQTVRRTWTRAYHWPVEVYKNFRDLRGDRVQAETQWSFDAFSRLHPSLKNGYRLCIILDASILTAIVIVAIVVASTKSKTTHDLNVVLYDGQCSTASRASFWIHLLINILASSLLAASTYMMQRLAAPSRIDIDRAHEHGRNLKIGTLAITNFALLSKKKLCVFALLWTTSVPIHLMFNSIIEFTSTNAQWSNYAMLLESSQLPLPILPESLLPDLVRTQAGFGDRPGLENITMYSTMISQQKPPLTKLSVHDCITAYASGTSPEYGDVIAVTNANYDTGNPLKDPEYTFSTAAGIETVGPPGTTQNAAVFGQPWSWMCGGASFAPNNSCNPHSLLGDATWEVAEGLVVDHCLVRRLNQRCEINMSLTITIVVIACICGKLLAMVLAVLLSHDEPILTLGDAISSFLEREENTNTDMAGVGSALPQGYASIPGSLPHDQSFMLDRRKFVFTELMRPYWFSTVLGLVLLGTVWGCFPRTLQSYSISSIWSAGLGDGRISDYVSYSASINASSYISGAIIANLPQLVLSFMYLNYNDFFTRFFLALEFRSYSIQHRGLRVTRPVKDSSQRRAYFLSFPLRYSLPNLVYFILLHTFLAEALFLHRTYSVYPTSYTDSNDIGKYLIQLIGYSPLALLILAILLSIMVLFTAALGLVRLDWMLPTTAGNSRAISALCHPPTDSKDTHLGKVRWGVTEMGIDGIGHCSFSALPVRTPEIGEKIFIP